MRLSDIGEPGDYWIGPVRSRLVRPVLDIEPILNVGPRGFTIHDSKMVGLVYEEYLAL